MEERSLVRLYMDLTGASEACARGVFMCVAPWRHATTELTEARVFNLKEKPAFAASKLSPTNRSRTQQEACGTIVQILSRRLATATALMKTSSAQLSTTPVELEFRLQFILGANENHVGAP